MVKKRHETVKISMETPFKYSGKFYHFVSPTAKMFLWSQTIVNYSCFSINKAQVILFKTAGYCKF